MNWFPTLLVVIFALGCVTMIEYAVRAIVFLVRFTWMWCRS